MKCPVCDNMGDRGGLDTHTYTDGCILNMKRIFIEAPPMRIGMGVAAARQNGYKHGREGFNTPWICCLTMGTEERKAWLEGYRQGTSESEHPYTGSYPPERNY